MTSVLRFARDLAHLEGYLEHAVYRGGCCGDCPIPAIAESYLHLLTRLAEEPAVSAETARIVAEAIDVWLKRGEEERQASEAGRQRQEAERAEAERRHELALTAECPYCGAAPGSVCHTAGPSAKGRVPKGVHDHRDRWRAALSLLDPDQRRDVREALERQAAQRQITHSQLRDGIRYLDRLAAADGHLADAIDPDEPGDDEEIGEAYDFRCPACGGRVGLFRGSNDWQHFRGDGTAASPVELYDAGHQSPVGVPVVTGHHDESLHPEGTSL